MVRISAVVAGADLRARIGVPFVRSASSEMDQPRLGYHSFAVRGRAARRTADRTYELMPPRFGYGRRLHGLPATHLYRKAPGSIAGPHRAVRLRPARHARRRGARGEPYSIPDRT